MKSQFSSATFRKQLDQIIDDLYLFTIDFTDSLLSKPLRASIQGERSTVRLTASEEILPLTEEAVKQCVDLSETVINSIIEVLKEEAIYQEAPAVLARRVIDLFEGERYKAVRWARTFSADVATNTTLYRYKQQGIEECQFYALIDAKTSPQCRTLHGTVWKVDSPEAKQYKVPLHYHCRSVILPVTPLTVVDDSLRYENRDFTKPVDQRFKPLDSVDADLVKGTFKNIDEFRDKWAVPQFILDEDIEKRLAKLSVGINSEIPKPKTLDVNKLKEIGSEWQKGDNHRIYFNNIKELLNMDVEYHKTGTIRNARIDGELISNSKAYSMVKFGKIWYNVKTGTFEGKDIEQKYLAKVIEELKRRS